MNGLRAPDIYGFKWQDAAEKSNDETVKNFEGYVLVWRRPGTTPFVLKVKYADYLRLHRMVSTVSPKAIYNCLAGGKRDDLIKWLNESTPWFNKYVTKWVRSLEYRFKEIDDRARNTYNALTSICKEDVRLYNRMWTRKDWALRFPGGRQQGYL